MQGETKSIQGNITTMKIDEQRILQVKKYN